MHQRVDSPEFGHHRVDYLLHAFRRREIAAEGRVFIRAAGKAADHVGEFIGVQIDQRQPCPLRRERRRDAAPQIAAMYPA